MKKGLLFLVLIGLFNAIQISYTQVLNPGFESSGSDLINWSGSGTVSTGETIGEWTVNPADVRMATMVPGSYADITAAETELQLSYGSLSTVLLASTTNFGLIYQDISLTEGQSLTFWWNYVSEDYAPFDDGSFASISGPGEQQIQILVRTVSGGGLIPPTGSYGSSGWHTVTFTVSSSGTYRLGFGCFNHGDEGVHPHLFIDNGSGGTSAPGDPVLTTNPVTDINGSSATCGGNISAAGGSASITSRGICYSTSPSPTANQTEASPATGTGEFSMTMTNLSRGTKYYVRAYATNSDGKTAYGGDVSFNTPPIYVDDDAGSGSNDGTNWMNAYTSLQSALTSAVSGDQVWVAEGTYKPTTGSDRTVSFILKNGVTIYGGFSNADTLLANRHVSTQRTLLSGDLNGNDSHSGYGSSLSISNNEENSYSVIRNDNNGIDATAVLDGFIIIGGNGNGEDPFFGGGGIFNSSAQPTIRNCRFEYNSGKYGAAVFSWSSAPQFTNCVFVNNHGYSDWGGTIYNNGGNGLTLNNCDIVYNYSENTGAGILSNNATSNVILNNSIVWGNYSVLSGHQFACVSGGSITMNYSCYSNGTADVESSGGTFTASNNNIMADPQFVNAATGDLRICGYSPCVNTGSNSYSPMDEDMRGADRILTSTIDMGAYEYEEGTDPLPVELTSFTAALTQKGVTLSWNTATEENNYGFEIERRKIGNASADNWQKVGFAAGNGTSNSPHAYSFTEIGLADGKYAYRLKQLDNNGSFDYTMSVEIEVMSIPAFIGLGQNYPNPFNPQTTISFAVAVTERTQIAVFNILGQHVKTLFDGIAESQKEYSVTFNASSLSSGTYFCKMQTASRTEIRRMILMK